MPKDTTLERPLPHNLDAERSVLGAILLDNHALDRVIEKSLKPEDFFLDQNRRLFDRMMALSEASQVIDEITLVDDLARRGELESVGGVPYVTSLTDGMPRVSNVEHYARIVKEKALLRALAHRAHSIQQQAIAGEEDAETVLLRSEESLLELHEESVKDSSVALKDIVNENYKNIEKIISSDSQMMLGTSWGFPRLDVETAGIISGQLIVIGGRPSTGKTALCLDVGIRMARRDVHIDIFSLETSKMNLTLRIACQISGVSMHKLRQGCLNREEQDKISSALQEAAKLPIYIDARSRVNSNELITRIRMAAKKRRTGLAIVDFIQLVKVKNSFRMSPTEQVTRVSNDLKAAAGELGEISGGGLIAISQLSRDREGKERLPQLSDLRQSGSIEQDADVVFLLHRKKVKRQKGQPPPGKSDPRIIQVVIAKQKDGPTSVVEMEYFPTCMRFRDYQRQPGEQEPDIFDEELVSDEQ